MTESNSPSFTSDPRRLDKLADGELNEAERRELLLRLDDEPDGWRRCALAFLEAQSWGREMKVLARVEGQAHRAPIGQQQGSVARSVRRMWPDGSWLAMAATVLVAFGVGWAAGVLPWRPKIGSSDLAATPSRSAEVGSHESLSTPQSGDEALVAADRDVAPLARRSGTSPSLSSVDLTFVGGPGGQSEQINLPVIDSREHDVPWQGEPSATVPPRVLDRLRRRGHDVQQFREALSLDLNNGQQVVVPVERVQIRYADEYQ